MCRELLAKFVSVAPLRGGVEPGLYWGEGDEGWRLGFFRGKGGAQASLEGG